MELAVNIACTATTAGTPRSPAIDSAASVSMDFSPSPATLAIDTRALMPVARKPAQVFVSGKGAWLFDQAGRRYLDFVQGWAVNCLGHSPDVITAALARQAGTLINPSPAFHNAPSAQLAALLAQASGLGQVFFASSGAEANEGAIKLARKWGATHRGGAYEIITMENAFHGRTLATMSASAKPGWDRMFEPKVRGFPKARLNDLASVEALIGPDTVGIMLEPIQGEAGVIVATDAFMQGVARLAKSHGLLLMLDEVQTGMGRTGRMFGFEHAGVVPDIMTLGKGIGGGVPLAALLATHEAACFEPGDQGGTYCGNPLMTAVGAAVFGEIAAPNFLTEVTRIGGVLQAGLQSLSARLGLGGVRGRGLLLALELESDIGAEVVEAAMAQGLLINSPRPAVLRFMPALNVSESEIGQMLALLEQAIVQVRGR